MKTFSLAKMFVPVAAMLLAAAFSGCTTPESTDQCKLVKYGGKSMEPYTDTTNKFRICIPEHLTKTGPDASTQGAVIFSGFPVPAGTTLESKKLYIVSGPYNELSAASPFGHLIAGGVTFQRAKFDEGSAGHFDLHIIYTWTMGSKQLHFDFVHHSVDPGVYPPGQQPPNYNQAAQIKLTEEIMDTFKRLP